MGQLTHKQAMLTMRGRRMLAKPVVQDGWPIARAAERMNVSRPTARKWVRRYEAEGEAGLADRPATPHRRPHRLSPARERVILAHRDARAEGPDPIGWKLGPRPPVAVGLVGAASAHRGSPAAAVAGRPRLLLAGAPSRLLLSVCRRVDPGETVAATVAGVDLDACPTWRDEAADTLDALADVELVERRHYLTVRLATAGLRTSLTSVRGTGFPSSTAWASPSTGAPA